MIEKTKSGYRIKRKICKNGSVSIPAKIREILKLGIGEEIIIDVPEKQA